MKFNIRKALIYCAFIAIGGLMALAGDLTDLPITQVGGRDCYYYDVKPQETVYSLCRRFGVSREELIASNPSAADGLKAGQRLYFPVDNSNPSGRPQTYVVEKSETAYGISKKFGLTTEEFYALNPEARDGLKAGQTVKLTKGFQTPQSGPVGNTASSSASSDVGPDMHEIAPHETLYQIARDNNTTVEALLAANPGLDERYYRAGQVIKIRGISTETVSTTKSDEPNVHNPAESTVAGERYVVREHDTFYGISGKYGVSVSDLMKANPDVDVLREGMVIVIPSSATVSNQAGAMATGPVYSMTDTVAQSAGEIGSVATDTITIAVALPFMLNDDNRSRQAKLYTEFYKGFMIAVDSLRNIGKPIRIMTYDTEGTIAGMNKILAKPELKKSKLIIGPDNGDQLSVLGNYGSVNGIDVMNLFVVKDMSYNDNPRMLQANIPHEMMYGKAIDYLKGNFRDFTPVILTRTDGPTDKIEFTRALTRVTEADGKKAVEIKYSGNLSESDFASLDRGKKYAFIPVTSKQAELNRILPALASLKEQMGASNLVLWGYPEWTTFRGETLEGMHQVNTYVFSRFYAAPEDYRVREIDNLFARWYGIRMAQYVPRQGLLGFDTGMYLLTTLNANGGNFVVSNPEYTGIQNGFRFIKLPRGGMVNNRLFFLNYSPGTTAVGKITL